MANQLKTDHQEKLTAVVKSGLKIFDDGPLLMQLVVGFVQLLSVTKYVTLSPTTVLSPLGRCKFLTLRVR